MLIDFSPLREKQQKLEEFATQFSNADLRRATNESIDYLLDIVRDLTDADVVFEPVDEHAHDPYAVKGEEAIGWSIAHLVAHVTAGSEEGAAFSSLLARGIPVGGRLRYETPWREITTQTHCIQRLEESRRMRLAYLDTWPDEPHLDVYREISPRLQERVGQLNATGAFLFGLGHEVGHYAQFQAVKAQALAKRNGAPA